MPQMVNKAMWICVNTKIKNNKKTTFAVTTASQSHYSYNKIMAPKLHSYIDYHSELKFWIELKGSKLGQYEALIIATQEWCLQVQIT